jgi:hypothetical protein
MVTVVAFVAATTKVVEEPCVIELALAVMLTVGAGPPTAVPTPQELVASNATIAIAKIRMAVEDEKDERGVRIIIEVPPMDHRKASSSRDSGAS